jgi:glycosyltransferase involved in cell wall biosynthesis
MRIGIYQAYWGQVGGGQRYVGVAAGVLARRHAVEIVHHCDTFDRARVADGMEVDLSAVSFRCVPRPPRPEHPSGNPLKRLRQERELGREISEPYDVFIDSSDNVPYFCHAPAGVLLVHFPLVSFETFHGYTGDDWRQRPAVIKKLTALYHRLEWRKRFATYGLTVCNSQFTRRWLRARWGRDAAVVYPPTRDSFTPRPKDRLIVNIAAFDASGHKKHRVLVDGFKKVCDQGLAGWELVLVGALKPAAEHQAYLEGLQKAAAGYPVSFRTNAPAAELRTLLERAAIYWHAMGHGVDPEADPGRMEHFGMVATEAMAAGCVPVVFNGGGLPESVGNGESGFLWNTLDDLASHTRAVILDQALRARLSRAAQARAKEFSEERFAERLVGALAPVLRQ